MHFYASVRPEDTIEPFFLNRTSNLWSIDTVFQSLKTSANKCVVRYLLKKLL